MISGIHSKKFGDKILTICESKCKVYVKFFVLKHLCKPKIISKKFKHSERKKKTKTQVLKEYK